jgi:hypothetical protein
LPAFEVSGSGARVNSGTTRGPDAERR